MKIQNPMKFQISNLKKNYQHPNPFEYQKRKTTSVGSIGGTKPPVVVGYDFNIEQKNIKFLAHGARFVKAYDYRIRLDLSC